MQIDWWTLGLQAINVLILVWLLSRFLFRPVAKIVEERRAVAAKLLDEAEAAKREAEAAKQHAKEESAKLAAGREEALHAATEEAQRARKSLLEAAQAEADKRRAAAEAEVARQRQDLFARSAEQASGLAVDIAAKLLERLPDAARIDGFVQGLAQGVAALPEATRAGIGAQGEVVHLRAARALSDAELEACRAALAEVLGRTVEIEVEVAPELIAGLELESAHAQVRNSFRADLDHIAEELRHDESGS